MVDRARNRLVELGADFRVEAHEVRVACSSTGTFLTAEYEQLSCVFGTIANRDKPAERVGDDAVGVLIRNSMSDAALDVHLVDQIILALIRETRSSTRSGKFSYNITFYSTSRLHSDMMLSRTAN